MKFKTIILTLTFGAMLLFTFDLYGQEEPAAMSKSEHARMDSLLKTDKQIQQQQQAEDKKTIDDAKEASKDAKVKADEAKRIEQDASNASNESKKALRTEKKAQKARRNADKQAQKAEDARQKSNNN
ncbi:MAG TPA: hypothetical protein VHO72_05690 [Bacteroidales bacterium]|nr:hypothetical protein [Bacteroidales bacterium]